MKQLAITMIFMGAFLSGSQISAQKVSGKNEKIVVKFLDGFNNPEKIQESLDLLSDDYKFKNPLVSLNSKAEFIQLAQQIGAVLTGVNVIEVAGSGDWVAAYYEFTSAIPGVESNLATEWFRIEKGLIVESRLIYDASEWRKVYAKMGE